MTGAGSRIVLASRNQKKIAELRRILQRAGVGAEVVGPEAFAALPEVAETGATFVANARLKAVAVARHTGEIAVADDSGLAVAALNGMPGVLSARWAGGHGDDEANLRLVLDQLRDVPDDRRGAAFVCAAVAVRIIGDEVRELSATGELRGRIIREPVGHNGFGYDPIFQPDGLQVTSAQLEPAEKDAISHRGQALTRLAAQLRQWGS